MPMTTTEHAAALLQCRMSWPQAERCAASLTEAGMPDLTRQQTAETLTRHLDYEQAAACADDLAREGLIRG